MRYLLSESIALRGWQRIPYAFYEKGKRFATKLSMEEYLLLSLCDGRTDLELTPGLASLMVRNLIRPAKPGEKLSSWQKARYCSNRYFPMANWSITGECNYNCRHCFMAADNRAPRHRFSREQWQRTLEQLDQCGVQSLTLTGGEPMLHPDFMEIMEEIYRRGMEVFHLNTNGSRITREVLEKFREIGANPLIKISFDGLGHHDWMRGVKGAEKQALDAIAHCTGLGFSVRVQTCVHRQNLDTLPETARVLSEMGVEEMRVIRTSESPRWQENAGDAGLSWRAYYDAMLDFTLQYLKEALPMDLDLWQFLQFSPSGRYYHYRPVEGGLHRYRASAPVCRGNRGMIAIDSDGELVPCNQLSGSFRRDGVHLGNVHKENLRELLSAGPYLDAVTCTLGHMYRVNEACGSCRHHKLCAGGCRALAYALTGQYLGRDPAKCLYFEEHYMERTDAVFRQAAEETGIVYRNIDDVKETGSAVPEKQKERSYDDHKESSG